MMKYLPLILTLALYSNILAQTTISYQPSSNDFPNPERGFYRYSETRSASYTLLDQTTLENYRLLHTPPSAGYSIYSTLVFRYFFLEDFKNSGKFVLAYGEMFDQKSYYLASLADKLYANPEGYIEFRGIGTRLTFYKKLLEENLDVTKVCTSVQSYLESCCE